MDLLVDHMRFNHLWTIYRANTDWKIVVPTLPGHGETLELKNVTAENWMMAAELALRQLQKEVDQVIISWIFNGWDYCDVFS